MEYKIFLENCGIGTIHGTLPDSFSQKFERFLKRRVFDTMGGRRNFDMLKLRYDGMKLKEIAERFGTSYQNVQQSLAKTEQKMKFLMTDREFLELLAEENIEVSGSKTEKKLSSMQKKQKKYSKYSKEPIENLLLPARFINALYREDFYTVEDVLNAGAERIRKVRFLGDKGLKLIAETLVEKYNAGKEWKL